MFIAGGVLVEVVGPFLHSGNYFSAVTGAQFDFGPVTNAVFRLLQQIKELLDGLPGNLGWLEQRPALIGDTVDATMGLITARVTEIVLHVTDDRVLPIEEVNR